MKLGIIARMDTGGGLQVQTHNLCRLLNPARVLLIDSSSFNGKKQDPSLYGAYDYTVSHGFPTTEQCRDFLTGLTHVITCETPYNYDLFRLAHQMGVTSYLQHNHEFNDYLLNPFLPLPTYFLSPSAWHLQEWQQRLPGRVQHLPPPTFAADFNAARLANLSRGSGRRRFVHVAGRPAAHDRNGTLSLLAALKHTQSDFELVITSQAPLPVDVTDDRVQLDYTAPSDRTLLYQGCDAMLLPRRYGGLCLAVCEALMSALPVVMPAVSPNDDVLPVEWLVPARKVSTFQARTAIDVYEADARALAAKIDWLCSLDGRAMDALKQHAYRRGYEQFSDEVLRPQYAKVLAL